MSDLGCRKWFDQPDVYGRLRQFNVWMEGYVATGQSARAELCGTYTASTFRDAVEMWVNENATRRKDYDPHKLSFWGCAFFDNEADARRGFG